MSKEAARVYYEQERERASARLAREQTAAGGRGRDADAPSELPAKGWKAVGGRVFAEMSEDNVLLIAAGVTFYLLLALAPLLAALVSIYGLFMDPASIATQAGALAGVIPGGGVDILSEQLERLSAAGGTTLGVAFVVSLVLALWSANAGMKSLFEAMNIAYDEREERSFVKLTLVTLCFTVLTIVGVIALIAFNTAFTTLQGQIGLKIPIGW